jgi:hypothetical protein
MHQCLTQGLWRTLFITMAACSAAACGEIGVGEVDVPHEVDATVAGSFDQDLRRAAQCVVQPNPVFIGESFTVTASKLTRAKDARVEILDAGGVRSISSSTDAAGGLTVSSMSEVAGPASVSIFVATNRGEKLLSGCEFVVVARDVCGNTLCENGETCATCSSDCGGCPPVCGDGSCEDIETCSSCTTDCGVCPADANPLHGYWIWAQKITNGVVSLEITEADLVWKVGPTGWEGCPTGIICLHYGSRLVAFDDASNRAHFVKRVTTGSDFQSAGTYAVDGSIISFTKEDYFSCAHPASDAPASGVEYTWFKRVGDYLWLSVADDGVPPFHSVPPALEPTNWIVFRRITKEDFHRRYSLSYCGAARDNVPSCNASCGATDVLSLYR